LTGSDLIAGVARGRGVVECVDECVDAGLMAAAVRGRVTARGVTRRGADTAGGWGTTGFGTRVD
jgi:hypothetical protein